MSVESTARRGRRVGQAPPSLRHHRDEFTEVLFDPPVEKRHERRGADDVGDDPDGDEERELDERRPDAILRREDRQRHRAVVEMLAERARRVPVVDGHLEGIVTITDVVRALAAGDVEVDVPVGELARRAINCVYQNTPLTVAERELSHADVPYAVVLGDDGDHVGMLTEVDVIDVARVVEGEEDTGGSIASDDDEWKWESVRTVGNSYMPTRNVELPTGPVSEFMTADLVTVSGRRTVQEVAQQMIESDIEQIPLVTGDELEGVVRDMDLLEALV